MSGRGESKSEDDLVARSRAEYIERSAERFDYSFGTIFERCESPIERVLLAALIVEVEDFDFFSIDIWAGRVVGPNPMKWGHPNQDHLSDFNGFFSPGILCAQAEIGPYRTDFAIVIKNHDGSAGKIIVIECDGHDFHERTKEQARHDKRRDRWMAINGITCLRFTGSEIWADAAHCADEVIDAVTKLLVRREI